MDRNAILKHSRNIRINNKIESDFIELLEIFCNKKGHPEHLQSLIQLLNVPMIGNQCLMYILEEFEAEYKIIKLNLTQDKNSKVIYIE